MSQKTFASAADLEEKKVTFERLSEHAWAYTAEGDPNTGVVIGDDAVLVADTQATPAMAADVIRRIREITDKPIKYVLLTHYHAVRVLGASAFMAEGGQQIIASQDTRDLIVERGEQDKASEIGRFPRLFRDVESVPPGLTWPTLTFTGQLTLWLGRLEVQMLQLGRGHTKGDTVLWLPQERTLLSGDLVEFDATPYAGDAYFQDWPQTLERVAALQPLALLPGRGPALRGAQQVQQGIEGTRAFVSELWDSVRAGVAAGRELRAVYEETFARLQPKYGHWVIFNHCLPFDVTRAYDEATQHPNPRIWTAERDRQMWLALEG
ncbi:Zn-dependent hydrolase, including glyoxylase [Serpentinimonas raichei]|uniref:Zn-dependent hydrolase, including glyoxylase n=1 Tax=Serpentinimonas raichei TaxID=1458425 RepID=A0A060NIN1_9BURK|nr:MBL fold metallo-hydrolase [Serpentinimonas raichei]BAO81217.1 Zn-dependent hydrolase, including glyoxylase [Serpentinimonas raichei]